MPTSTRISISLLVIALLSGCASPPSQPVNSTQGTTLVETGQVVNVRDVTVRGGRSSGIGAFAGAVLGSVAASTIGSGHGSTVASIGGALAGGMAGQHVEESAASDSKTEVSVRLDSGEIRTFNVDPGTSFRIGDTVKVTTSAGMTRITHE